jgi:hypothetical protein
MAVALLSDRRPRGGWRQGTATLKASIESISNAISVTGAQAGHGGASGYLSCSFTADGVAALVRRWSSKVGLGRYGNGGLV